MKLYGYEPFWYQTAASMEQLNQTDTALAAMRQLFPCGAEPVHLFLGRGVATHGDTCCPLLVLRAQICLDDGTPRIVPAEDTYHLCTQTLRCAFGADRDMLFNMQSMLDQAPSPDALPTLLDVWGRLLQGYGTVQPGQVIVLAAHESYDAPADAAVPAAGGTIRIHDWANLAAEQTAAGSRVLLTARSPDRLCAVRAALPADLPALGDWDDGAQVRVFAQQILEDIEQTDALTERAGSAVQHALALHEQLQGVQQTIDHFRADWQPACSDVQARNDSLLPDDIPAGAPFPLDDAQLALLRTLPGAEPESEPDDAVEQLCLRWANCRAAYQASPVWVGGHPAALSIGTLTLDVDCNAAGAEPVALDSDALELLLQLHRRHSTLEREEWLLDALACRNDAQLTLYRTLADALSAAAQCLSGLDAPSGHRVEYKGTPSQRAKAIQALRELETQCAVWESGEPYAFSDFKVSRTLRAAYKVHGTLVDGTRPGTQKACRAARAELEMQQRIYDVRTAWQPLCGHFDRQAADCGPLARLLRLCLACGEHDLHLCANELPLAPDTVDCITLACSLAQQHASLYQTLEQQGASHAVLQAVRTLDLTAYHKECDRAAQAAHLQALRTRAAVVEVVRRQAPLWAAQLDTGVCPEADMRAVWEEKSARTCRVDGIGRLLAREQELSQSLLAAQQQVWALQTRVSAARRAADNPLTLALLMRAARGAAGATACAVCAPVFLTTTGKAAGFDQVIADRNGMSANQIASLSARAAQAVVIDVQPTCVPELHLVSAGGDMGFCRAAERLIQGSLSERMGRIWWQAADQQTHSGQLPRLVQQQLTDGHTVAVVSPDPETERSRLIDHLSAALLCTGKLYCGDAAILSARQFDTVILCPGLTPQQLIVAACASLDASTLWVLDAEQYGADWGRSLLLCAWQKDVFSAGRPVQTDTIAQVLTEMYGWEAAIRPDGLELSTPTGPVWLAVLGSSCPYPLDSGVRVGLYEAGWKLDGLSLPEYQANPRQVLQRLAIYGSAVQLE